MVNIPNYSLTYYQNGNEVLSSRVIVGRPSRKTPLMSSALNNVVVNPPWNVPTTLVREDIVPKAMRDGNYFQKHGYTVLSGWSNDAEVILRGASGHAKMIVKTHGDGRIVNLCSGFGNGAFSILPTPTGSEHVKHQFPYWEYEYSLLAKAMLWAAGRAPPISVEVSGELRRPREAETTVAFKFSSQAPFKGRAAATWQLIDGTRYEVAAQQFTVAGEMTIEVPVPPGMPVGTHALELSVFDDQGRVVDWWRWP